MDLEKSLWERALRVHDECAKREAECTRALLSDALSINDNTAKLVQFALQNRHIIRFQPSVRSVSGGTKELILADLHIPYHDKLALQTVLQYADELQPDIITLLGDVTDFYKISKFVKDPRRKGVAAEIKETREFLEHLRKRFPNAKITLYEGNHEQRFTTYLCEKAGEIIDLIDDLLPVKLGLSGLGIDYQTSPYAVGKLWHLHGHETNNANYNPEHITNVVWEYVYDHFICAHYHRTQEKTFNSISGKKFYAGVVGYLAGEMEHCRLNKFNQGFAVVRYAADGTFVAKNHRIVNGEIY